VKAAVYYETGPPEVFRYEDVPKPTCHPRGVLIDVEAISIEGGDVLHRAGGEMTSRPHIVGYQFAGRIREIGSEVDNRVVGERVVATVPTGSHAEIASVAAHGTWRVPDGMALEQAACVPIPFGTADDCHFEFGGLEPGESVLVQGGGGGVGLATIQLAKRHGAMVFATASNDGKLARLADLGVDHGINYVERDLVPESRRLTDGRGIDLVVDPIGGDVLQSSLECLAYRGRLVTVGNMSRADRQIDISTLSQGNRSISGVFLGAEMGQSRVYDIIDGHITAIAAGDLQVVVDRRFPLAEAVQAHAYIESRQAFGRVLLIP
jgi:NADPH2:quinone reductase